MKTGKAWIWILAILTAMCATAGYRGAPTLAEAIPSRIVGGPFVVNVTSRAATVAWVVQSDQVSIHPADEDSAPVTSPALRMEKTTLTGLLQNTRYEYSVGSGGEAGKGSFKTPPMGNAPYEFVVYGDTRTRNAVHSRVIGEVLKSGIPDFVIHTGDLVANGEQTALWPTFFDIEGELLRQTAFFPSLGNHERNSQYFYDVFHSEPHYSFDWGNGHFIVIDSDIENVGDNQRERDLFWYEQTRWLEEDLRAHQKAAYRFLIAHHPPLTAVARRQGDNPHMIALMPMLEKYDVAAGLFGHDHNYQHYLKNGIHYVITGGGGAPLYDVDKPPEGITQKAVSIENFVRVSVNDNVAHFRAISIDGTPLDEFEIQGRPHEGAK